MVGACSRQRRFDWLAGHSARAASQSHMVWTAKKRPIAALFVALALLTAKAPGRKTATNSQSAFAVLITAPRIAPATSGLVASRWYRPHQSCTESLEAHARGTGSDAAR